VSPFANNKLLSAVAKTLMPSAAAAAKKKATVIFAIVRLLG